MILFFVPNINPVWLIPPITCMFLPFAVGTLTRKEFVFDRRVTGFLTIAVPPYWIQVLLRCVSTTFSVLMDEGATHINSCEHNCRHEANKTSKTGQIYAAPLSKLLELGSIYFNTWLHIFGKKIDTCVWFPSKLPISSIRSLVFRFIFLALDRRRLRSIQSSFQK